MKTPKPPIPPGSLPADQATALVTRIISSFNR
jgi:hypothetical protein